MKKTRISTEVKEIKPCPFCGGSAYINHSLNSIYIECYHTKYCVARPNTWFNSSEDIYTQINKWNRRIDINGKTNMVY